MVLVYCLLKYKESDLLQAEALEFNTKAKIQNPIKRIARVGRAGILAAQARDRRSDPKPLYGRGEATTARDNEDNTLNL